METEFDEDSNICQYQQTSVEELRAFRQVCYYGLKAIAFQVIKIYLQ